jgi:putative hydrolase of the HAD superfamily
VVFEALLIDLDDTLYPSSSGLWGLIRQRIDLYLHEKMGFPLEEVTDIRRKLFTEHGTTMRGLQKLYGIDVQEYLQFVHNVPVGDILKPDPSLKCFLESLPFPRYIFTNADVKHADRVLKAMHLEDEIQGVIDILAMEPYCKPQLPAFQAALKIIGNPDPQKCILIDDTPKNLEVAKFMGFWTVLVKEGIKKDLDQGIIQSIGEFQEVYEKWAAFPAQY